MEFTSILSINTCRSRLAGHASQIPVLADTEVHIFPLEGERSEFIVRRKWKGRFGLRFNVMEVKGTLNATKQQAGSMTHITAYWQPKVMSFVFIAIGILVFLYAFSDTGRNGFFIVVGLVMFGLLAMDWYILRGIILGLES